MNQSVVIIVSFLLLTGCSLSNKTKEKVSSDSASGNVEIYKTKADKSALFSLQPLKAPLFKENGNFSITVNPEVTYQEIDGFGFSLTGGSALYINKMSAPERTKILNELFNEENIGVSYLRISIGASDLDPEVFSYNDLPDGETDEDLENFSIARDKENLIPVLKEILAINPDLKIMGSPWSAPTWMKTSKKSIGGSLKPEYFATYANYFVKYIQAMQDEGIHINAITIQNEPLHDGNNPSMYMLASDQAKFIKNHLGPAFETANLKTKIVVYDHNADRIDYPMSIFSDKEANKYVDGSAFHLYGGVIGNLSKVHDAYPDKNLFFTEQWVGAKSKFEDDLLWHTRELIIGATRNWCKTVLEWNLAAGPDFKPHTPGGCTECLGALTIDGDKVQRNVAYYIIAHASKFVRPGSYRVESNYSLDLPNVAFKTPAGGIVVIVVNNTKVNKDFNILVNQKESITTSLEVGAVGTYVWK